MNKNLSEETLKHYRDVAFDCQPEMKRAAEARGFKSDIKWRVSPAYRENYDNIKWNK